MLVEKGSVLAQNWEFRPVTCHSTSLPVTIVTYLPEWAAVRTLGLNVVTTE